MRVFSCLGLSLAACYVIYFLVFRAGFRIDGLGFGGFELRMEKQVDDEMEAGGRCMDMEGCGLRPYVLVIERGGRNAEENRSHYGV